MGYTENGVTPARPGAGRGPRGRRGAEAGRHRLGRPGRAQGGRARGPLPGADPVAWATSSRRSTSVRVATLGTDLSGAVARAEAVASSGTAQWQGGLRPQRPSGRRLAGPRRVAAPPPAGGVNFFVVRVRPAKAGEPRVTAVQYAAARPTAGVPFAIRPHLTVQGDRGRVVRPSSSSSTASRSASAGSRSSRTAAGRSRGSTTRSRRAAGTPGYVEVADATLAAGQPPLLRLRGARHRPRPGGRRRPVAGRPARRAVLPQARPDGRPRDRQRRSGSTR